MAPLAVFGDTETATDFAAQAAEYAHLQHQSQQLRAYFRASLTHYLFSDYFEHCLALPPISSYEDLPQILQASRMQPRSERPFLSSVERPGRCYTYGQVNRLANQLAHFLASHKALQLPSGAIVGLWMENSPEYFIISVGLAKLGYTALLLPTRWTCKLLDEGLKVVSCSAMIVSKTYESELGRWMRCSANCEAIHASWKFIAFVDLDTVESDLATDGSASMLACTGPGFVTISRLFQCLVGAATANPSRDPKAAQLDAPLFLIFTSGTTGGKLKCARFSHARYLGCAFHWGPHVRLLGSDRVYSPLPMYHGNGGVILPSSVMLAGAMLYTRESFSARHFWSDVVSLDCHITGYIGECWRYVLLAADEKDPPRRRLKATLGNGLSASVWRAMQSRYDIGRIVEHYGATEMPGDALVNSFGRIGACGYMPVGSSGGGQESALPAGQAGPILVRIEPETLAPVRDAASHLMSLCLAGEPGEALFPLASPSYAGYVGDATANRNKVYQGVLEPGDAWWSSGDVLTRDREGHYYFVDRMGSSYRWKGENVACALVSEILLSGLQASNSESRAKVVEILTFGVQIPHHEGRAGMSLVRLQMDSRAAGQDRSAVTADVLRRIQELGAALLTSCCQPVFLRLTIDEPDKTPNMKYIVHRYAAEGFSPAAGENDDEIYFRPRQSHEYIRLTVEAWQSIQEGRFEF